MQVKLKRALVWGASAAFGLSVLFIVFPSVMGSASPFPSAASMWAELRVDDNLDEVLVAFGASFIRFLAALVIGTLLGVFMGLSLAHSWLLEATAAPWVDSLRVTPALVWIAVLYVAPFPNDYIPVAVGALISALYVLLPVREALQQISPDEHLFMRSIHRHEDFEWKFRFCYAPRIVAAASNGLRMGGSIALILVVVAEALLRTESSLGNLLVAYQESYAKQLLWVVVLLLSVMAIVAFGLFGRLKRLAYGEEQ